MENGRFIRTFSLIADQTPMLFMIAYVISRRYKSPPTLTFIQSVTPVQGKMNHYTFSLSWKAGGVHRSICQPVTLKLTLNPRQLTYNVLWAFCLSFPHHCQLTVTTIHQPVSTKT